MSRNTKVENEHYLRQVNIFRKVPISFYLSIVFVAVATITAKFTSEWLKLELLTALLIAMSLGCVIFGLFQLISEVLLSHKKFKIML